MKDGLLAFLFGFLLGLLFLIRYLETRDQPFGRENCQTFQNDGRRMVAMPAGRQPWETYTDECGDVDIIPIGEEHKRGKGCRCEPTVNVAGSKLVVVHNAYDHREIIEQAVAVINGDFRG